MLRALKYIYDWRNTIIVRCLQNYSNFQLKKY